MSAPSFDLTKFYRMRLTAPQAAGVFRTLRKLDARMKERVSAHRQNTVVLLVMILVGYFASSLLDPEAPRVARALAVLALAFAYVTGCFRVLFGKTRLRIPKALVIFGLLNPGCFLYIGAVKLVADLGPAFDPHVHPLACAAGIALSSLLLVFLIRLSGGTQWKRVQPDELELGYVESIVTPLLREAPKGTRCELLFNPFHGEWSRVDVPVKPRPGYTIESTADVLLELRLPVDEQRTLKLSVHEHSVSKTKDRKSKYKGTKHRIAIRYDLDLPSSAKPDETRLRADLKSVVEGGNAAEVELVRTKDRLSVRQRRERKDDSRELKQGHLIPAAMVLKTIALLARATAAR